MSDPKLESAKILTHKEEQNIDKEIKNLEDIRDEVEVTQGVNFEARNKGLIESKIRDLRAVKSNHAIPRLSDKERTQAEQECKILEADLQRDMPTWQVYAGSTPRDGARHTALVTKIYNWEHDPVRRQKVMRWKRLRRMIDPENPKSDSTMYLFPDPERMR